MNDAEKEKCWILWSVLMKPIRLTKGINALIFQVNNKHQKNQWLISNKLSLNIKKEVPLFP